MKLSTVLKPLGFAALLLVPCLISAQSIFVVGPENDRLLVVDITEEGKALIDGQNGPELAPDSLGEPAITDFEIYKAGIVMVQQEQTKARNIVTSEGKFRKIVWKAHLIADRNLKDNWMAFRWGNSATGLTIRMAKLPDLVKNEAQPVRVEIFAPKGVDKTRHALHFFSGGYEIASSETTIRPNTPREQVANALEGKLDQIKDSPAQLLLKVAPPPAKDADGNTITGTALIKVYFDRDGYIYNTEILEANPWQIGMQANRVTQLWTVRPTFKDGTFYSGELEVPIEVTE